MMMKITLQSPPHLGLDDEDDDDAGDEDDEDDAQDDVACPMCIRVHVCECLP